MAGTGPAWSRWSRAARFAPGASFGGSWQAGNVPAERAEGGGLADAASAPPPGALQSITPELIRRQRAAQATDVGDDVKRLFGVAQPYRIGSGDILNIVVWDHPDLVLAPAGSLTTDAISGSPVSNGYNVSPDGLIQFPYVGNFKVGGLTEYEVRDRLTARLAKYFNEPKITVRIQSYRAGRVYVDGEVRTPGPAGGERHSDDTARGHQPCRRLHRGCRSLDGRPSRATARTTQVNLQQLTALGVNPANILLGSGDLVRVLSRDEAKVYVMGEVTRPAGAAAAQRAPDAQPGAGRGRRRQHHVRRSATDLRRARRR